MHTSSLVALFALCGASIAAAVDTPNAARSCVPNGFFYGEEACKSQCEGGKCTVNDPNAKDYICICKDTSKPGCGDMFKGKGACQSGCSNGDCTQLLVPYTCKC